MVDELRSYVSSVNGGFLALSSSECEIKVLGKYQAGDRTPAEVDEETDVHLTSPRGRVGSETPPYGDV